MTEIHRLRRAGGGVLRLLNELLPVDLHRHPASADEEICLVFADVVDYSDLVAAEGDDAAIAILEALDEAVEHALAQARTARVVKRLGDGLMITAERPEEAVRLAVALRNAFADRTAELEHPMQVRVGVHRGTCRRHGRDYFGYHVNLAARITASALGDQVLATANVLAGVDLDEARIIARPAGRLEAKGVTGRVAVFQLACAHREEVEADRASSRDPGGVVSLLDRGRRAVVTPLRPGRGVWSRG